MERSVITLFVLSIFLGVAYANNFDYGVMVDAGSTGCRVFLYQWEKRITSGHVHAPPNSFPVTKQTEWSYSVKIPLASFAHEPTKVDSLLTILVDKAKQFLTSAGAIDKLSATPFYLGATAGMRLLPFAQREKLMLETRRYLETSGFLFHPQYARILSGEEEGVFGWMAVNYLLGNFNMNGDTNVTVGALDLGGASTQITMDPKMDMMEGYFPWQGPYRRRYDLYTHSFLYYGGDQFWLKALRSVADTTNTTGELVPHPCINTGNIVNIENTWKVQVNLAGAHNPTACRELVRTHVSPTPCWSDQCSLAGTYTPPIPEDQPFYLFSSFPSVLTTAGMTIDEPLSVNQIDNYASTVPCNLNWSDMLDKFPQPHNDTTYLTRSCVSMMYISVLLGEGYKFPPDSKQLHFVNKVGDNEVYWALGCILYEANMLDWDQEDNCKSTTMLPAIIVSIVLAVVVLILAVCLYRAREALNNYKMHASSNDPTNSLLISTHSDPLLPRVQLGSNNV